MEGHRLEDNFYIREKEESAVSGFWLFLQCQIWKPTKEYQSLSYKDRKHNTSYWESAHLSGDQNTSADIVQPVPTSIRNAVCVLPGELSHDTPTPPFLALYSLASLTSFFTSRTFKHYAFTSLCFILCMYVSVYVCLSPLSPSVCMTGWWVRTYLHVGNHYRRIQI